MKDSDCMDKADLPLTFIRVRRCEYDITELTTRFDAIDSTNPLFNTCGFKRQVVVDYSRTTPLKVQSFLGARIAYQHTVSRVILKCSQVFQITTISYDCD